MKHLNVEEVDRISAFAERKKYDKNDALFLHGEKALHVYILLSGCVLLRLPAEGEEFRISVAKIPTDDPQHALARRTVERRVSSRWSSSRDRNVYNPSGNDHQA